MRTKVMPIFEPPRTCDPRTWRFSPTINFGGGLQNAAAKDVFKSSKYFC